MANRQQTSRARKDNFLELLQTVLCQPTAPFRESWVVSALRLECERRGLALFEDKFGNLWLNARSLADVKKSRMVFVAHMDHPGFIVEDFEEHKGSLYALGKWIGGGPLKLEKHEVKVFSHVHAGVVLNGTIESCEVGKRSIQTARMKLLASPSASAVVNKKGLKDLGPWGACLWYGKTGVSRGVDLRPTDKDVRIVTKAADDLAGICALIEAFTKVVSETKNRRPLEGVTCLFSRAEEGGFHGTIAVLESKWLNPLTTLMVSVETSSAIGGAEIGKGPVVRLGDRTSVFDPGFVKWVQDHAQKLAGGTWGTVHPKSGFAYQRRVMDGGSCEASAFNAYGFQVAGLSVPLGGYHNIGPSQQAVPEEVSLNDAKGTMEIVAALLRDYKSVDIRRLRQNAFGAFKKDVVDNFKQHRKYF